MGHLQRRVSVIWFFMVSSFQTSLLFQWHLTFGTDLSYFSLTRKTSNLHRRRIAFFKRLLFHIKISTIALGRGTGLIPGYRTAWTILNYTSLHRQVTENVRIWNMNFESWLFLDTNNVRQCPNIRLHSKLSSSERCFKVRSLAMTLRIYCRYLSIHHRNALLKKQKYTVQNQN